MARGARILDAASYGAREGRALTISPLRRLGLIGLLALASCGSPTPSAEPTAVPTAAPATAASPTTSALSPTASAAAAEIERIVGAMAAAVEARDRDLYLEHVDLSDPVFSLEHTRWVADWADLHPATSYALAVDGLTVDGVAATGRLTASWTIAGFEAPRTATWQARFTGGPDGWRYAGEVWRATEAEHFRLLVAPGVEGAEAAILPTLPDVYDRVTSTLGYAPAGSMQIKVYADPDAHVANTLLTLPRIRGWNEPGEALKIFFDAADPSVTPVVAHEFTHFVLFDRAGTKRTRMPWWLDEGTATFVARPLEQATGGEDARLRQVAEWAAANELAEWTDMAVFEETPVELWRFVYPQGYAMVAYVTDAYGDAKRNAWLAAMATQMTIDDATPAVLGVSFEELDAGFRSWLVAR
jgi:hypothetical protein